MSAALSDALLVAQRRALQSIEKAYVGGKLDAEAATERLAECGITDPVDLAYLLASLDVLKEWGAALPAEPKSSETEKMSAKQRDYLTKLAAEKGVHLRPGFEGLSKQQASEAISELQAGTYDQQQDVPF